MIANRSLQSTRGNDKKWKISTGNCYQSYGCSNRRWRIDIAFTRRTKKIGMKKWMRPKNRCTN